MSLTINGLGGSYTPRHRAPPRNARRGQPPPEAESGAGAPPHELGQGIWQPEQSRAEVAALTQAIQATETAGKIVGAAAGGLSKIADWLAVMRGQVERGIELAEAAAGPPPDLTANQRELDAARSEIAELVDSALFGRLRLLDGGLGCTGKAFGEGLEFVRAPPEVRSSSPEGYAVWVSQEATRASALVQLEQASLSGGQAPWLAIEAEGGRAAYAPRPGQNTQEIVEGLNRQVREQGLEVVLACTAGDLVLVHHNKYGSAHRLSLHSSLPGVFSLPDGRPLPVDNGLDVEGSINGEPATGQGQILTGCAGNRSTGGLAVRFSGKLPATGAVAPRHASLERLRIAPEEGEQEGHLVGRVIVAQQPLVLRTGAGGGRAITIRLNSVHPSRLGLGVENESDFRSVDDVRLGGAAELHSALQVLRRAEQEVSEALRGLADLSGSVLVESLSRLRAQAEEKQSLFTNIADARGAQLVASALRAHMQSQGQLALQAQTSPLPGAMMRLLDGDTAQGYHLGREC